ncbi:MAG: hypothetical protein ACRYGP_14965 [Janthinobacterium lividum]
MLLLFSTIDAWKYDLADHLAALAQLVPSRSVSGVSASSVLVAVD